MTEHADQFEDTPEEDGTDEPRARAGEAHPEGEYRGPDPEADPKGDASDEDQGT